MGSVIGDGWASDDDLPESEAPDSEVLRRLRHEPALIETLWCKHAQRVYRYLARRVGPGAAEDLLSDVFVAALDARRRAQQALAAALDHAPAPSAPSAEEVKESR